jgi:hypothetical protein
VKETTGIVVKTQLVSRLQQCSRMYDAVPSESFLHKTKFQWFYSHSTQLHLSAADFFLFPKFEVSLTGSQFYK